MSIRAVVFDVGGTLLHAPVDPISILHNSGIEVSREQFTQVLRRTFNSRFVARTGRDLDIWGSDESIRAFWNAFYADLFTQLGVPERYHAGLAEEIQNLYWRPESWVPFPETRDVLTYLQEAGFVLGALSDWNSSLPAVLDHLDLHAYFAFVVVSAFHGVGKPSPRLFELAVRKAGVRPEEAVYVGDTYMTDIVGARVAGLHPVLINRSRSPLPADCPVIGDLWELLPLLEQMQTSSRGSPHEADEREDER